MVLAALPEEDAPREREERRKGFALGMQEAEAIVRKQRTEGMGMVDATKARDAAADCISIRACAFAAMFAAPASPPSVTPGTPAAKTPTQLNHERAARLMQEITSQPPYTPAPQEPATCPDGYTHDHDCTDLGCNGTGRRTP
jgi:hypothetical protein